MPCNIFQSREGAELVEVVVAPEVVLEQPLPGPEVEGAEPGSSAERHKRGREGGEGGTRGYAGHGGNAVSHGQ